MRNGSVLAFSGEERNRHGAIANAKFVIKILEMVFDRVFGNSRARRNLQVGPAVG